MITTDKDSLNDLVSSTLLAELRRIELRTKKSLDADLMGKYRSAFRGSGLVFSDLREYLPGDDIKNIHWKATARTNRPYVKTYDEDRQLNVLLLVDVSNSTAFGSPRSKHIRALEFAALIALLAHNGQDLVGLSLFSDEVEEFYPPKKSRNQFQRIIMSLLQHRKLRRGTDLKAALSHLLKHQRRTSVIFIVSDFWANGFEHELAALAIKHDVICVFLEDAMDSSLPSCGLVEFEAAEASGSRLVDTSSSFGKKKLSKLHQERLYKLKELCQGVGADLIQINDNPLQPLIKLMNQRTARVR